MKRILCLLLFFFMNHALANRILQGPPFPWHDWYDIAYQGPNSFHQKSIDVIIQNVSNIPQTIKLTCKFSNLTHDIGSWSLPIFTPLIKSYMDGGTTIGTNTFEKANIVIPPLGVVTENCKVNYSSQENMGTNFRDAHQRGILLTTIEVSEDRGAIIAFLNSKGENGSTGGAHGPELKNNGSVTDPMLRNISKTFFFNGGRAF